MVLNTCGRSTLLLIFLFLVQALLVDTAKPTAALAEGGGAALRGPQSCEPVSSVAIDGQLAYLGTGSHLTVLDVSESAVPAPLGRSEQLPAPIVGIGVAGAFA